MDPETPSRDAELWRTTVLIAAVFLTIVVLAGILLIVFGGYL